MAKVDRIKSVFGSISKKYPSFRDDNVLKSSISFLDGKRADDNAEGLWRIHDKLYDLSTFIEKHPGGRDWIALTKGVDITEYFETHHLYGKAEELLPKYYIREAALPRNYNFTFKPDGFYMTLKKRVMEILPTLDNSPKKTSDFYSDITLIIFFALAIATARFENFYLALLSGCLLNCQFVISHNYYHRKDSPRMYGINLSGSDYTTWRVTHIMSHHIYTNSYHDVEVTFLEPFLQFLPRSKTSSFKLFTLAIVPIFYCVSIPLNGILRFISNFRGKEPFKWDTLIVFITPTIMLLLSQGDFLTILKLWYVMLATSSFFVGFFGLSAGHHHPDVYHEGDELSKSMDFGIYQINAVIERHDFLMDKNNHFIVITTFGQHTLHHLFPTLDHGLLKQLVKPLLQTAKEFELELREYPWWPLLLGNFQQMLRTETKSLQEQNRLKISM